MTQCLDDTMSPFVQSLHFPLPSRKVALQDSLCATQLQRMRKVGTRVSKTAERVMSTAPGKNHSKGTGSAAINSSAAASGRVVNKETKHEGKFLRQSMLTYELQNEGSKQRKWEMCERTSRDPTRFDPPDTSSADACTIACICNDGSSEPKLVVVYQFRPPCNAVTVELPAGLIDTGMEHCTMRQHCAS